MDWLQSVKIYIKVVEEGSFNGVVCKFNIISLVVSKCIYWFEECIGV